MPDALTLLARAIGQTAAAIDGVRPDQGARPTPCAAFDLRALVNHTVFDATMFASSIDGGDVGAPDADLIGNDWSGAFRQASDRLLDAWRARGIDATITTRVGEFPASWAAMQHTTNFAVHSWDIAVATDQSTAGFDEELADASLEWARQNLKPEYRGPDKAVGVEVAVPASAPAYDRLVGFFGRQPGYAPPA